ncbi:hypothetical protein CSUB01_06945 [Colletotrichum sublineola]|uniref:Uncharacterized protein n=1 Tax=Colletotrichum sublineola TaxID=1173701 RepID=A0A066X6Q1_COLSU|nr:hypothetical protein CSUB01_06945 [Colletotrichum sublineola]
MNVVFRYKNKKLSFLNSFFSLLGSKDPRHVAEQNHLLSPFSETPSQHIFFLLEAHVLLGVCGAFLYRLARQPKTWQPDGPSKGPRDIPTRKTTDTSVVRSLSGRVLGPRATGPPSPSLRDTEPQSDEDDESPVNGDSDGELTAAATDPEKPEKQEPKVISFDGADCHELRLRPWNGAAICLPGSPDSLRNDYFPLRMDDGSMVAPNTRRGTGEGPKSTSAISDEQAG